MDFDDWFEVEGRLMLAAGCTAETIAQAAWHVATHDSFIVGFLCAGGTMDDAKHNIKVFEEFQRDQ